MDVLVFAASFLFCFQWVKVGRFLTVLVECIVGPRGHGGRVVRGSFCLLFDFLTFLVSDFLMDVLILITQTIQAAIVIVHVLVAWCIRTSEF